MTKLIHDIPFLVEAARRQNGAADPGMLPRGTAGGPHGERSQARTEVGRPSSRAVGWIPLPVTVAGQRDAAETCHYLLLTPSGKGKSLWSQLDADQRRALDAWAQEQPGHNGMVDLLAWPGWASIALAKLERHGDDGQKYHG